MTGNATNVALKPTDSEAIAHNSVIALYDSHSSAEAAVRALAKSRFDMKHLSIAGTAHGPASHVEKCRALLENVEYHNGTTRGCCLQ